MSKDLIYILPMVGLVVLAGIINHNMKKSVISEWTKKIEDTKKQYKEKNIVLSNEITNLVNKKEHFEEVVKIKAQEVRSLVFENRKLDNEIDILKQEKVDLEKKVKFFEQQQLNAETIKKAGCVVEIGIKNYITTIRDEYHNVITFTENIGEAKFFTDEELVKYKNIFDKHNARFHIVSFTFIPYSKNLNSKGFSIGGLINEI